MLGFVIGLVVCWVIDGFGRSTPSWVRRGASGRLGPRQRGPTSGEKSLCALLSPLNRYRGSPLLPQPRHRSRPLRSSTLAAGLNPTLSSCVSSATWWQPTQSTLPFP